VSSDNFRSVYAQLMDASTLGTMSARQLAALRALDGVMVVAEHVMRGTPVGAGAHATICALMMDCYAKGRQSAASDAPRAAVEPAHSIETTRLGWLLRADELRQQARQLPSGALPMLERVIAVTVETLEECATELRDAATAAER
jgi:hypothetical protein